MDGRILDILFWCFAAGVVAFILGVWIKILWDSMHIFKDYGRPYPGAKKSSGGTTKSHEGWSLGALGTTGVATATEVASNLGEGGSDMSAESGDSGSESDGGDSGGGDSGGGDFSGGGGDSGGGGSSGGWS